MKEEMLIHSEGQDITLGKDRYIIEFGIYYYPTNKDFQFLLLEENYDRNDKLIREQVTLTKTLSKSLHQIMNRITILTLRQEVNKNHV